MSIARFLAFAFCAAHGRRIQSSMAPQPRHKDDTSDTIPSSVERRPEVLKALSSFLRADISRNSVGIRKPNLMGNRSILNQNVRPEGFMTRLVHRQLARRGGRSKQLAFASVPHEKEHEELEGVMPQPSHKVDLSHIKGVNISASRVLGKWKEIAAKRWENIPLARGLERQMFIEKMRVLQGVICRMSVDTHSDAFLGLTNMRGAQKPEDIYALATVQGRFLMDNAGKLDKIGRKQGLKGYQLSTPEDNSQFSVVRVLEVSEIVRAPNLQKFNGLGEEMLLQIVKQGAASGRLVVLQPANEHLIKYYQKLGFEKLDAGKQVDGHMAYSGLLPATTRYNRMFKLVRLLPPNSMGSGQEPC